MKENQELIKVFSFYKRASSQFKKIILITGVILIFVTMSIFTGIANMGEHYSLVKWLYSIPVSLIIVCVLLLILNLRLNRINKAFKEAFLQKIVKAVDFDAIYTYEQNINKSDLTSSSILNYNDSFDYKFSEFINGKVYDYKYKSAFLTIKKKDKNQNYIPFNGRIFIIDYFDNLDFLIYEKNNEYSTKRTDCVYEDDIIKIYSNDFPKQSRLLRKNVITKISKFIGNKKMTQSIEFIPGKIIITSWDKKEKHSLSEMNTINNISQDYIHELNLIKDVLDTLEI